MVVLNLWEAHGLGNLLTATLETKRLIQVKVTRLAYALDETTLTMPVEASLPNPTLKLRPGMYVSARTGVGQHPDVLRVPSTAVIMEKTNAFVFVHNAGKVKKTPSPSASTTEPTPKS